MLAAKRDVLFDLKNRDALAIFFFEFALEELVFGDVVLFEPIDLMASPPLLTVRMLFRNFCALSMGCAIVDSLDPGIVAVFSNARRLETAAALTSAAWTSWARCAWAARAASASEAELAAEDAVWVLDALLDAAEAAAVAKLSEDSTACADDATDPANDDTPVDADAVMEDDALDVLVEVPPEYVVVDAVAAEDIIESRAEQ